MDQGRESSVCPTSSAAMSASYVLSRYFAFPSPGSSRYVEDRLPSFLTYPYPFELAAHAYAPTHRSIVPSRPILAIFRVLVWEREWVSGSISRWVPVFPPMGSPLPLSRAPTPYPRGHHGGVGCNPGPLRRLSSLLPDPFEVGKGVKWGISHPTPTYQHMIKRSEVKTESKGGGILNV